MDVYVVASLRITNPEGYRGYPRQAAQTILQHGGEVLAADADSEVVEGDPAPMTVIVRFPSRDAARAWYGSDDYQRIAPLRTANSEGSLVFIDGLAVPRR